MKRIRKTIAGSLAAILTYIFVLGSASVVFAAPPTVIHLQAVSYDAGKLVLTWDTLPGVQSIEADYYTPDNSNEGHLQQIQLIPQSNTVTLSGLQADYIYELDLKFYDAVGAGGVTAGNQIGEGLMFYLPKISFRATTIDVPAQSMGAGGGVLSGSFPRLLLQWKAPRVCMPDGSSSTGERFMLSNTAAAMNYINNKLDALYNDNRASTTFSFRINISSIYKDLNNNPAQTALTITQGAGGGSYQASLKIGTVTYAAAVDTSDNENYSFMLWGHSDSTADYITSSEDPNDNPPSDALTDPEILPGTVYYMNIKPVFTDTISPPTVTVGGQDDQNGSLLSGTAAYAFTPIMFQLTKDSLNNIYVKIFRINQGSLDLPRLYYEVQSTDDPTIAGDWVVKRTMVDSNFSGNYAVTVINGVNPNNLVYYKIVVKSDGSSDRLESLKLPYMLTVDTGRPPLPTGIAVVTNGLDTRTVSTPGDTQQQIPSTQIAVKSTDITISWDKPLNYNTTGAAISFHFLLSTSQSDVSNDVPIYIDGTYWGKYPSQYRQVLYVDSSKVTDEGSRLSYKLDAFSLFKGINAGSSADTDLTAVSGNYPQGYPTFLLPNTVYYLKMYTTSSTNKDSVDPDDWSDVSVITSFTTLSGTGLGVPMPNNFAMDKNNVAPNAAGQSPATINNIELTFDKVTNIDWSNYTSNHTAGDAVYYELYMSTSTDAGSFGNTPSNRTYIGSTQDLSGDVLFTGANDPAATSIRARINTFTGGNRTRFGGYLMPNTTYYFILVTKLHLEYSPGIETDDKDMWSDATAILPVTTVNITNQPPDDNSRKPLAPVDFSIALDGSGDQLLTGNSVTFTWQRQENDVIYELVRTAVKLSPSDQLSVYNNDPEYASFLAAYDAPSDGTVNSKVYLDPAPPAGRSTDPTKFSYNPQTRTCTYLVDRRMFPNKLYYFSLKAVRVNQDRSLPSTLSESAWVSIPVTTKLIDPPVNLEIENNSELGFYWTDTGNPTNTSDDYSIYVQGPNDSDYVLMTRSQCTIVKDNRDGTYYGRVLGLKPNSSYDIKVVRGIPSPSGNTGATIFDKAGMTTRDSYHQMEVKWQGKPVDDYPYATYQIAIKAEDESDYTILDPSDLESYVDVKGRTLPYYTEENAQTVAANDLSYFHARIKTEKVVLAGGLTLHQPLRSNVKYYVKVRAVDIDAADTAVVSYSKYAGPVSTRTDFNQDDYDNTDRENKQKAVFLDRMKQLDQGYYWKVALNSSLVNSILLKGDKVVNAISGSRGGSFTLDLTGLPAGIGSDDIYVPVNVIKALNTYNKSLVIRTPGADFTFRPKSLDAAENKQIKDILSKPSVKDLYLKLTLTVTGSPATAFPSGLKPASQVEDLGIQAYGSSKTDSDFKQIFYDKLYNKDSGLVSQNLNILQNTYIGSGTDASQVLEQYTGKLIDLIENQLSTYIYSTIDGARLVSTTQSITDFSTPASASLPYNELQGVKTPYVLYDGTSSWQKLSHGTVGKEDVSFNIIKTGQYAILVIQSQTGGVADSYWARDYISKLASKYDLSDVFTGVSGSFMPDNKVSGKELVLLYEKVTGQSGADLGRDIQQQTAYLGLDGIINTNSVMKNVNRQQTAAVLVKLFAGKKGLNAASLRPKGNIYLADEDKVDDAFYNQVLVIIDWKVMTTDEQGNFNPQGPVTRADVAVAFVKLLDLSGDM